MRLVPLAVVAAIVAVLPAQTFVVDANNGPGTDFTSVDTALTTVPDGATILVKPGNYLVNTTVTGKGLTILSASATAPVLYGVFGFTGLSANQHVVVKGIKPGLGYSCRLTFDSCQGRVHLEDCGDNYSSGRLIATQCAQVSVVRSAFTLGGLLTDCDVVCSDTRFQNLAIAGGIGITISGGRTRLARCSVTGGLTYPNNPPYFAAIAMSGANLAVVGAGTLTGGGNGAAPAVSGTGTLRIAAGVSLVGTCIPFATINHGWTTSTPAPLGGMVTGKLEGSANLFGALVFGVPRPPTTFAGIGEELWVEPFGLVISGPLGSPLTFWLDVPNEPSLTGFVFGWQGLTVGAVGGFVLSNPAWFCVQ